MKLHAIENAGLVPCIENDEYHNSNGISSSQLKLALDCPARYKASLDGEIEHKPTPAMQLGTVLHSVMELAVLGVAVPQDALLVVSPKFGRSKKDLEAKAAFHAEHLGKTICTQEQYDQAMNMAESLLELKDVQAILSDITAKPELSGWWPDDETGLLCKYRPDVWTDWCLVDWKTAQDASPSGFSKAIANYGYHVSAAHYLAGDEQLSQQTHNQFVFGVVESKPPHLAAVYVLDDDALAKGRELRAGALRLIKHCTEEDYWPGYGNGQATHISLPKWAF